MRNQQQTTTDTSNHRDSIYMELKPEAVLGFYQPYVPTAYPEYFEEYIPHEDSTKHISLPVAKNS